MTNQVGNQIDEVVGLVGACCVVLPADHELVFVWLSASEPWAYSAEASLSIAEGWDTILLNWRPSITVTQIVKATIAFLTAGLPI